MERASRERYIMIGEETNLKDLEYAIKWLISQNWIDADRIGVFRLALEALQL